MTTRVSLDGLDPAERIVTIGAFDGVHRGHAHLLAQTVQRASDLGLRSTALTFEPLPAQVLYPERFIGRICLPDVKGDLMAASAIDEIVTMPFNLGLAQQSPEEFLTSLVRATSMRELWVGEAFALGRNRSGDLTRISAIGKELGFDVVAVKRLADNGRIVSSSSIRSAISAGDAAEVVHSLGRPFRVTGPVIYGAQLGRTIGYPTANVAPPLDLVPLADGIYTSDAILPDGAGPRASMTYVGTRPTVNTGARLIETHLLDFDGDLYGQTIHVDIWTKLRGDMTFDGLEPLIEQLRKDEDATREYFAERSDRQGPAGS